MTSSMYDVHRTFSTVLRICRVQGVLWVQRVIQVQRVHLPSLKMPPQMNLPQLTFHRWPSQKVKWKFFCMDRTAEWPPYSQIKCVVWKVVEIHNPCLGEGHWCNLGHLPVGLWRRGQPPSPTEGAARSQVGHLDLDPVLQELGIRIQDEGNYIYIRILIF